MLYINYNSLVLTATVTDIEIEENSSWMIPDFIILASGADADLDNADLTSPWSKYQYIRALWFKINDNGPVLTLTMTDIEIEENSSGLILDFIILTSDADVDNARFDVTLE